MSFAEWSNNKKKKEEEELASADYNSIKTNSDNNEDEKYPSFSNWSNNKYGKSFDKYDDAPTNGSVGKNFWSSKNNTKQPNYPIYSAEEQEKNPNTYLDRNGDLKIKSKSLTELEQQYNSYTRIWRERQQGFDEKQQSYQELWKKAEEKNNPEIPESDNVLYVTSEQMEKGIKSGLYKYIEGEGDDWKGKVVNTLDGSTVVVGTDPQDKKNTNEEGTGLESKKFKTGVASGIIEKGDDGKWYHPTLGVVYELTEEEAKKSQEEKQTEKDVEIDPYSLSDEELLAEIQRLGREIEGIKLAEGLIKEDERTWFDLGAFEDGYDFGDVTKSILGTVSDTATNIYEGMLKLPEAVADTGAYLVGGGAKLLGNKYFADTVNDWIAEDWIDERKVAETIVGLGGGYAADYVSDKVFGWGEITDEENSMLGEKSQGVAQSVGEWAIQAALTSAGVPWWLTTGVQSAGSNIEEGFKDGEGYGKVGVNTATKVGVEILGEKLFGGSGLGEKGLINVDALTKGISNKSIKALLDFGIDVYGEGEEEAISAFFGRLTDNLTYEREETWMELLTDEEAMDDYINNVIQDMFSEEAKEERLESRIGGMFIGGIANAGKTKNSVKNGTDYHTGLTKNDQKVFDKLYDDALSAKEKESGKKPTSKEKAEIYDSVMEQMEKGYISTDTIEEVLGGDDYKAYKDSLDSDTKRQQEYDDWKEEYDALYNTKGGDKSDAQIDRQSFLKKQIDEFSLDSNTENLRRSMSRKVYDSAKDGVLAESYRERARKTQAFQADLSQYKGKQREAVDRAIKSGVLNNTNRSHELVDILSKLEADKGVIFDYTNNAKLKESGFSVDGKTVNGFEKGGTVTLNVQSAKAWQSVVGHEITHVLEGTDAYTALQTALYKYAEGKGELASRKANLTELYKDIKDADIDAELTADLVGDYLFSDSDFIKHLTTDRNVFQKVYDEVKYLCKVATGKELTEIEKVKHEFDKVWKELGEKGVKTDEKVNLSVSPETDTTYMKAVESGDTETAQRLVDEVAAEAGYGVKAYHGTKDSFTVFKQGQKNQYDPGYLGSGFYFTSKKESAEDYASWKKGDGNETVMSVALKLENPLVIKDESKPHLIAVQEALGLHLTDFGDYLAPTKPWISKKITEEAKKQGYDGIVRYVDFMDETFYVVFDSNQVKSINAITYDDNGKVIPLSERFNTAKEDIRYSVSADSEGNQLSKEQIEYFKDSKVVDENGNLKVMYHGTYNGEFYTFDKSKGSVEGDFGSGFYFTDNETDVENNYEGGGPDFENKIWKRAEQIYDDDPDISMDEARKKAKEELYKGSFKHTVYLNIENPVIVGETNLFDYDSYAENYDRDDYDTDEDYEGEIEQLISDDIDQILWDIERNIGVYGFDDNTSGRRSQKDAVAEVLWSAVNEGGIDIEQLKANINNLYLEDSNGNLVGNEVTRQIVESLGYDGIIDSTVSHKWNMEMEEGTTHYIVFKPNQIKSINNQNPTDNEDIRYSLSSMANTFYGDENMSSVAFEESDYKQTDGYKNYVEKCVNNMRQTRTDFDETVARQEIEEQIDGIVRVALAAKKAGYDIADDASKRDVKDSKNRLLFSSLEPNSDYFTSNDISTICDKRKNFAEIYDDIVRAEEEKGVPKGKRFFDNVDNYFYLHDVLAKKGLTQPCRECYVESMRKNLAPMANAFLKLVNETDVNNKANDQLYQPSGKNKGQLKSNNAELRQRVLETFEEHPEYGMSVGDLTVEMLTTENGLAQLKIKAPLIYEAFNSFYGQSKPKMPKSATPFRFGELTALLTDHNGKIKQSLVDKINSTGGFRLQSYSDFQIQNYTDVLQVIFEAGTLGLNGHAYTKVPAFLEATEGTNLKRNISIFMYKDGNEWKLDKNDSFPAESIEEIYNIVKADKSGNTGIIAVSQNKDMSCWIMANDNIAYGIPFHKSGLKMATVRDTNVKTDDGRIIKGYSGTIDHTKQQTEVWAKANEDHNALTKVKKGINIYSKEVGWDFDNKSNLPKNKLIEKNVKAYINACERAGYLPKFREYVMNNDAVLTNVLKYAKELGFVSPDATVEDISFKYKGYTIPYGYYKFLGDFSMFTPDGKASPHEVLSLNNYNFDKAEQFFADAEGLHRNEILQQFANDGERQKYRDSDLDAEGLAEIVKQKRKEVVDEIVAPIKNSLSNEGEDIASVGTPLKDLYFDAPVREDIPTKSVAPTVAEMQSVTGNVTPAVSKNTVEQTDDIAPIADVIPKPTAPFPDEIAPMTEEEANAVQDEKANAHSVTSLEAIQTELANLKELRSETYNSIEQKIAKKQAELNSKKNTDTKTANNLRMQIERLKRLRDSNDADYVKKISTLETREKLVREGKPTTRQEHYNNIISYIKSVFNGKGFDFDNVLKKAKNLSTFSTVDNTPQRVMEKALGYKEGQALADITVNRVAQNETEGIKWLNSYTDRKNGFLAKISKQYNIKPGSKESAAAQMYAEGFYVTENNEIVAYGDAELAKDFPKIETQYNIKGLANDPRIRKIYDDTLDAINESRKRNAYPEIQKLDNYFLHFRAMDDTFSKLGLPFNPNDIKAKDLPTDLNGVTADLKPGQPYFASANHRTGKRTSFDLLGGLERYLTSAKNQIYHIDDIQMLRALRNYIADTYGQANGLEGIDALTEEEAQEKIEQVYNSHLSTFAKFLNEEANVIAGKTALIDRGLEGVIGRRGMTFLDTVRKQTGSNMVGFNVSSSLTNFLPVTQAFAKSNKADFIKAFAQTVSNKFGAIVGKGDGFAENSPVMIRRKGTDRFYRTPFQKAADTGYVLMGAVDSISTELIARTKFNEFVRKGMSEQQAHIETDKWVSRLMGDRSLGQQPQLYNSKTLGFITQFQLEVRNQLDSQFYDTIQEAKVSNEDIQNGLERNAKTAAKVTSTFVQLAVAQHLFGKAFESVAGYNPAFDIIEVLSTLFGFDDDEESEDTALDNIEQGFLALLEDLPYTSAFTDGGRIPISSALPISELITGKDSYGNEKSRWETLGETIPYYMLPSGYGQIKKTTQGLGMFDEDLPVSGSYTDSGNLRFPVEDTFGNRLQAGLFGQYANKNAREYFDNDYAPLKEKQIQEYIDVDMPISDYWKYREGLSGLKTNAEKAEYINDLDISDEQKNILMNNILDRKEDVDMSNYDDYSGWEEFDYATKNPEKYEFFTSNGISYETYSKADEDGKNAYNWAYNNPEKYTLSKAVTDDVVTYRKYANEMYDIKADKDEDGKSINGSRKEKVINYLNDLELDYEAKIILFKIEYPSDDTYNNDIVNYINNLDGLTYEERVTIFTELGFIVQDGYVNW